MTQALNKVRASLPSQPRRDLYELPSEAGRDMAEIDTWSTFGVDKVDDRIEVRA